MGIYVTLREKSLTKSDKCYLKKYTDENMRCNLEETSEEEEVNTDEEEDGEDDASILPVAIPGDGDCFYLAIVEAFLREGIDIVQRFIGKIGCEVQNTSIQMSVMFSKLGNGQWGEVSEACRCRSD